LFVPAGTTAFSHGPLFLYTGKCKINFLLLIKKQSKYDEILGFPTLVNKTLLTIEQMFNYLVILLNIKFKSMKTSIKLFALIMTLGIASACSTGAGEKTQAGEAQQVKSTDYDIVMTVDKNQSSLGWEGYKPTGQHHGIVEISNGELMMKDGRLTGGKFAFDMNTITVHDLTDPEWNGKLTGHLKSADFFEVEAYPTATFEITAIEPLQDPGMDPSKEKGDIIPTHSITGNLTMKGITKGITFNAKIDRLDDMLKAESNMFFLDRTEWNVQFKSKKIFAGLKDDFINDEMGIKFQIVARAQGDDVAAM
jgi:polyisoprenoid-binding protein YceI